MAVLTGADGQLKYQSKIVAKARDWTISVSKDALEDTHLGLYDRTYVEGLRGATGSMTVLYDPSQDEADTKLLNSIFANGQKNTVDFVLNRNDNKALIVTGFLTSVSHSVSVGAVQACSCNFQISGGWSPPEEDNTGRF